LTAICIEEISHPKVELLKVRLSGIKPNDMTMVLGMNGERLFFENSEELFMQMPGKEVRKCDERRIELG